MSNQNYSLEIISHHPKFSGKTLRKYHVDGIDTVGAFGDEKFSIRFTNHTWQKVQIKLSLDGTDILTGKPADTEVSKDMWVVNGYGSMTLKAWPETQNGGASFVFTSANNSVAVHTHGDLSCRGIIAAAVFTEGHVEPIKVAPEHHHHYHYPWYYPYPYYEDIYQPMWIQTYGTNTLSNSKSVVRSRRSCIGSASGESLGGGTYSSTASVGSNMPSAANAGYCSDTVDCSEASAPLESLVSIGAGDFTEQNISYVAGLIKPVFTETVRVRYQWWDELREELRAQNKAQPQPSGFPGDKKIGIDLKGTPRIGEKHGYVHRVQQEQMYSRF